MEICFGVYFFWTRTHRYTYRYRIPRHTYNERSVKKNCPMTTAASESAVHLLSPKNLPLVLGDVVSPGIKVVTLINRSGMLIGCAGDMASAAPVSAIVSNLWQSHEKCEGQGSLNCLLLECEEGRLAIKAVGSFILACCSDTSIEFGLLKAKVTSLHDHLLPSLQNNLLPC